MPFQEISSPSLRKLFVQQLEGLILSGELRPGDRLPTERELADEMKISKTVVHEGLRELYQLGFLQVESRKGVTVADYAQTGSLETLMAIMDYHGGLPDKKTASSILDLRYYLEAPALRQLPCNGINFSGLHGFLAGERRQDAGQTLCQHGFAGAGCANEQYIVSACGSNDHSTPRQRLADRKSTRLNSSHNA